MCLTKNKQAPAESKALIIYSQITSFGGERLNLTEYELEIMLGKKPDRVEDHYKK
ncbi:MAG: hypothetical protein V1870_02735 [Candidatus Aenigmatarchaeota archaeon]